MRRQKSPFFLLRAILQRKFEQSSSLWVRHGPRIEVIKKLGAPAPLLYTRTCMYARYSLVQQYTHRGGRCAIIFAKYVTVAPPMLSAVRTVAASHTIHPPQYPYPPSSQQQAPQPFLPAEISKPNLTTWYSCMI